MLYPKNTEHQLSEQLFKAPGCEYRGTPFWAWNCELQKEDLLWQLEVMKKMGFGGAHMHVRTGMATPYLSEITEISLSMNYLITPFCRMMLA